MCKIFYDFFSKKCKPTPTKNPRAEEYLKHSSMVPPSRAMIIKEIMVAPNTTHRDLNMVKNTMKGSDSINNIIVDISATI